MDQFEAAEAMGLLSMLFEAFPTYDKTTKTSETAARAYLVAIEGCSLAGLRSAVHKLIRGEVEAHSGKGIPSTAILARTVRDEDEAIRIRAAHANRKQIARQAENVVELDPETRAKRARQLKALAAKLGRDMSA